MNRAGPPPNALVTADTLEVTGNGTLVFREEGNVCLVIQPESYGFVQQVAWHGLRTDEE